MIAAGKVAALAGQREQLQRSLPGQIDQLPWQF
jgi:hypothetical protein